MLTITSVSSSMRNRKVPRNGMLSATQEPFLNLRTWPLLLAGLTFVALGCGRRQRAEEEREAGRTRAPAAAPIAQVDWKTVEQALGRPGAMQSGDVYRFGLPRTDLAVTVAGIHLQPALALGSWVAFKATSSGSIAMGDLVVRDDEIAPVMATLIEGDIAVTALHHHLLHETPRVYYMHIHGAGDAVTLARAIRAAIDRTNTPPPSATPAARSATLSGLDTARIARALGHAGKLNGTVYQVSVPRPDTIREDGVMIPPAMGVATALNFQPAGRANVASAGDFVLRAAEVNPVLLALRAHGIDVTAVHNHMLGEEPRLLFAHFWAVGDAAEVAEGLRTALDVIGSAAH